ncbi:MAG: hypothetical protein AAGG50_20985 [Bacteroidota bacterium]
MAFSADTAPVQIQGRSCTVVRFLDDDRTVLRWPDVAQLLAEAPAFRFIWNAAWATPFAHMWKPVPIHPSTRHHAFFAVLVPSRFPAADASAYQTYLDALTPDEHVASFANLGGTSHLVVPAARGAYGHLAAYCRTASPAETHAFWRAVGTYAAHAIDSEQAVWCNIHGHGVPWLHVRFDPTHKYTAFPPHGAIDAASQAQWYRDYYAPAFPEAPPSLS